MSLAGFLLLDGALSGGSGGGDGCGTGCLGLISALCFLWLGNEFVNLICPFLGHQLVLEFLLSIPFIQHIANLKDSDGEIEFKNYAIGLLYYNALAGLVYAAFGDYGDRAMAARHIFLVVLSGWLFLCAWYKTRKKSDIDKSHYGFVSAKWVVLVCAVSVLVITVFGQDKYLDEIFRSKTFVDVVITFFRCVWDAFITILKHSVWWSW